MPETGFVVAYDASCGPCSTFKRALELLGGRGRLRFVPLDRAERSGLLDSVEESSRYSSFHLLRLGSGGAGAEAVWSGAEAILPLAGVLHPVGAAASRLARRVPGATGATAFAYSALSSLHRGCPAGSRPRAEPR